MASGSDPLSHAMPGVGPEYGDDAPLAAAWTPTAAAQRARDRSSRPDRMGTSSRGGLTRTRSPSLPELLLAREVRVDHAADELGEADRGRPAQGGPRPAGVAHEQRR